VFFLAERYDAIIVGAGPSGSSCAALLAAKGCKVLLIDKAHFPRDKPCGDAIGGKALNVLSELGLQLQLKEKGFLRNSGVVFSSPSGDEVEIPLVLDPLSAEQKGAPFSRSEKVGGKEMSGGFVCRRQEFDFLLFKHAKEKCETLEETEVDDLIFEEGKVVGVKTRAKNGAVSSRHAKLVIGADGATSLVARKTGCAQHGQEHMCSALRGYYSGVKGLRGNVEIHFLPECMPGYFWVFPLSEHEANVGVGMLLSDIAARKINLSRVLEACLKNAKFASRFANAELQTPIAGWSLPLASAKRKCAGNGFVLLGDAASLIDPFSGEGIGNGMKSAKIAADVLGEKLGSGELSEEGCLSYQSALWKEIGADVESSYNLQKLGKHAWLLNFIIGKAKRSEWVRNELAGMIASREAKKKATNPLFYLRMLLS